MRPHAVAPTMTPTRTARPAGAGTFRIVRAPAARLDAADAEILALVRAGASGRQSAAAHRRALQEKASLFVDFEHFRRLCLGDLHAAFVDDRQARIGQRADPVTPRMTKNRRRCWLAAFRCYARHAGIAQGLEIVAIDRQGHYACRLIDKAPADDWDRLVRLAEGFGIDEASLKACLPSEATKKISGKSQ